MKKVFLLIAFFIISSSAVFAQDQCKTFEIGDGGIVKITPEGSLLSVQIIYNNASDAPETVKEKLRINDPAAKQEFTPSRFKIKFLNEEGAELCNDALFFGDFTLDETADQPKAVLKYQAGGQCGTISYSKINSVVVNYDSLNIK
ncbi:MAG: hypothetical protein NT014_04765 [Candidatus Omnitrophica bacterium]|nr:hypothetical protein [Candidatus Omnitrophota bacterium]